MNPATTVDAHDHRYPDLVLGHNTRFTGRPDRVHLTRSAREVARAVAEAVRTGARLGVRSGGQCFEDLVTDPAVRVLVDLSGLDRVRFDRARGAFAVEAGATLGQLHRTLFTRWGVAAPIGSCPGVGAGGHILGGGYGPLSRRFGSVVDHLHGVEVVVVDAAGDVRVVEVDRDSTGDDHDLWWAHTGGGGGNFGIATRFWLRAPDATGTAPAALLPRPPGAVLLRTFHWPWQVLTERSFSVLLRNFGEWYEEHGAPDSTRLGLFSSLVCAHRGAGAITLVVHADGTVPDAERVLAEHVAAINSGVGTAPAEGLRETLPWLRSAQVCAAIAEGGGPGARRTKVKSGYLRRGLTEAQRSTAYRWLTDPGYDNPEAALVLLGYGGRANAVAPSATALVQRDSVIKALYVTNWSSAAADDRHLAWIRHFHREVYAETGGVPAPGPHADGAYVNYPDADLADPAWNTSGLTGQELYHGSNLPRLQRIKARWDPLGVFRHRLSITAPRSSP
ncbi:FAD-binding oxidoreductase [Actinokineospora globicatena]|uniref:FAD-linked oxidase n=1 Tax=Actinokineospora globicatena TaxID=103729 RepID=A0A9W6QJY6_9PSEU|nr:FAD-binding protein [Actinokineospora globicatena]GLW89889.1 FAD-linked oxidase [Actinokineospora globicatena]